MPTVGERWARLGGLEDDAEGYSEGRFRISAQAGAPSVCGYQLLGGATVPDIGHIYPSTMLGEQSWAKPNTFETFNSGARFDYDLSPAGKAFAEGGFSHSLIDDNVVYAYGCYNETECSATVHAPHGSSLRTARMTSMTIATPASCASTHRPRRWSSGISKLEPSRKT